VLVPIVTVLVALVLVPGLLIYRAFAAEGVASTAWWLRTAAAGGYLAFVFFAGRWDWVSYEARYLIPVAFAAATLFGYARLRRRSTTARAQLSRRGMVAELGAVGLFLVLTGFEVAGRTYRGDAVRLTFPLDGGTSYVAQGGDSTLINYHHSVAAQRYALDLVLLNPFGLRARGFYPSDLHRYEIFGTPVHSPCDGSIEEAVDDLPDQHPPERDPGHPAGNHIVIACEGVQVLLAHLQEGTVGPRAGEHVSVGQILGRVGNSGNTSEPHLHIHAQRARSAETHLTGVPMLFDGRFLARNDLVIRPREAAPRPAPLSR
jgi:hypothetical protein